MGTQSLVAELSRRFKEDGMLAYIQLVQQKERELGVDILTHQKWSVVLFEAKYNATDFPTSGAERTTSIAFCRVSAHHRARVLSAQAQLNMHSNCIMIFVYTRQLTF